MLSVCPGVEGDPTGGSEGRGRASGSGGRPPAATAACRPRRARLSSPKVTHAAHADGLCALVALSHPSHSGGALDPLCPHRGLRPAFLRLLPLQRANAAIGRSERPPRSRGCGCPSREGAFRWSRDCIERGASGRTHAWGLGRELLGHKAVGRTVTPQAGWEITPKPAVPTPAPNEPN